MCQIGSVLSKLGVLCPLRFLLTLAVLKLPNTIDVMFTRTSLHYVQIFAIANPSVVCLSSVTFVRPTQGVEIFRNISSPFCTLAIL